MVSSLERDLRGDLFDGIFDLEELGGGEAESVRDEDLREDFTAVVIEQDGVVEGLAGEGDAVLGRRELFHQGTHGGVGLELRILLGDDHESTEGTAQAGFGLAEVAHGGRVVRVAGEADVGLGGLGAGFDDGRERAALVGHVAFGGLDEIRDQVVAALELHVHLGKGVLTGVTQRDEAVVDAYAPDGGDHEGTDDDEKDDEKDGGSGAHIGA